MNEENGKNGKKKSIRELSADSLKLYDILVKEFEVGKIISYKDLTDSIRRDVQTKAYGNLATARKMAKRDNGLVFGTLPNIGYKCLSDPEIARCSVDRIKKIRRESKAGLVDLSKVKNYDKMPEEDKITYNLGWTIGSMIYQMTTRKNQARLQEAVKTERLSYQRALDVFREQNMTQQNTT
uniref:Uncharacterized protein n=1 Tax=viral metagenome TaxID=1070528 RepID=A0A6H2A0L2_9ZZZZ